MPIKLNVGLARKVADDHYGSRGASVNLEIEAEGSIAAEPSKLQNHIRQLFNLVRASIDEELQRSGGNSNESSNHGDEHASSGAVNAIGHNIGNGSTNGQQASRPRPATQSQIKAIYAIARNQHLDLAHVLYNRFKVNRPDELTIGDASQLIDELKQSNGRGGKL